MKIKFAGEVMTAKEAVALVARSVAPLKCWSVKNSDKVKRVWVFSGRIAKAYTYVATATSSDDFDLAPYRYDSAELEGMLSQLIFKRDWEGWIKGDDIVVVDIEIPQDWHIKWVVDDKEIPFENYQLAEELEKRKNKARQEDKFFSNTRFIKSDPKNSDTIVYVAVISGDTAKAAALLNDLFGPRTTLTQDMQAKIIRTEMDVPAGEELTQCFSRLSESYLEAGRQRGVYRVGNMLIIDDVSPIAVQNNLHMCLMGRLFA